MTKPRAAITSKQILLLPWLVLIVALTLTWLVWDHERQSARKELHSQFDFALRDTVSRLEQRVAAYEQMLRGMQSLLATTPLTNRTAIHDYVETLQLDANFSGIRVIGIVEKVSTQTRTAHVAAMRRQGLPDYTIHPDSQDETLAPIIQREPDVGQDQAVLGFDPWTEPVRRLAMEKARDSGLPSISGKVRLAVDHETEASPGFIMYLPIFAHGQPRDSVAQRRVNIIGWVYAAFHMRDFMASLYGKQSPGLALSIFDDVVPTAEALMYRSPDEAAVAESAMENTMSANEYMVVAGHTWTVSLSTQQAFETLYGRDAASVIAVTGICLSLSLALLVWQMVTGRVRALRLAAEMTEELRHMAQHDPLTKLPNRALFSDRLNQELTRARRHGGKFALIFLDLDHFKPINDNFGHAVGDGLLQQMAQRLQASIRASDTVGRIGGDEFVVLLAELTEANAALALAEKIRMAARQPFIVDGNELLVSCSLGVAVYPDNGSDEITLTKSADEAMYRAKDTGRNSVVSASNTTR